MPEPDCLYPIFHKNYWESMGGKTITYYRRVFIFLVCLNILTLLLYLIPKFINASPISNYISIILCNTNYNLVIKIIVNIIKTFTDTIIKPSQANFFSNKRVSCNVIIVQEYVTHFRKIKKKNSKMILKNDLEKAFGILE